MKPFETFDFSRAPGIGVRLVKNPAESEFVHIPGNVIFLGKSGTGKTHLATALGVEACKKGIKTRFVTGCALNNELIEAGDEMTLSRVIRRYAGYELLILDEPGYVPFSKDGAELIFQVLTERNEKKSVILTSNKGFGDWTEFFGDTTLTAALLDRIPHKACIIQCNWESYRLRESILFQKEKCN